MRLKYKFLFLFLASVFSVFAQNLLQNPSFEDHPPLEYLPTGRDDEFALAMKPWRILNSQVRICDCKHLTTADDIYHRRCRYGKVEPHTGCTMIELQYGANCLDWDHETRGCSSYLGTKLKTPLEMGKVYEVSCWLNILPPDDPEYVKHIGFSLYPDVVRNPRGGMFEGSAFVLDTAVIGSWRQVKWLVRPLCRLQFLVFGVFRGTDGPPVHSFIHDNVFYIDDISVTEISAAEQQGALATPHCKYKPGEAPLTDEIEGANCYFETGDSSLTAAACAELDSFALRAKTSPKVAFLVTGHTDSIGENHKNLSEARVESVLRYLEEKHRIPRIRFARYGLGRSGPVASNKTTEGRRLNRRVSLSQIDVELDNVIYRHLLEAIFDGKKEAAYKSLNTWLLMAPDRKKIWMLNDPRLYILMNDQRWKPIHKRVKESYSQFKKPDIAFQLDSLWAEDQKPRTLQYYIENLNSYYAQMDSTDSRWNVDFSVATANDYSADESNYSALMKIMDKNGWPKSSEVGERAAKAAFLIVNHRLDTTTLSHFIPIVEERCMEGEAEWIYYATMYDRLQILLDKPQRYGTQFKVLDEKGDKIEMYPLEDPVKLNEWRQRLDLEPLILPKKS